MQSPPLAPYEATAEEVAEMLNQAKVEQANGAESMVGVQSTVTPVSEMHSFKSLKVESYCMRICQM